MVDLFRERKWDLVGLRNLWFALSIAIILPGVVFWALRGLNYGIDFTGGGLLTYRLARSVPLQQEVPTLAKVRAAIQRTGIDVRVQLSGTATVRDQLLVRTRVVKHAGRSDDEVLTDQQNRLLEAINTVLPGTRAVGAELVTPVVSRELLWNAVKASVAGMVFILLWVWLRYQGWKWGLAALIALVHDILVLMGAFAITQREVNSPFVAAALTVLGYSVHDTIVIFDRIRENVRLRKGATFAETANISLLETMARSVNTVLTTELVLVAVYLLGGHSLRDFTFAMIVGITVGAYSSIFNASQLMVVFKNREERALARRRAQAVGRAPGQGRVPRAPARPVARPQAVPERAQAAAATAAPAEVPTGVGETGPPSMPGEARTPREARRKLKAARKRKKRF